MSKHTPGPWRYDGHGYIWSASGEQDANARLIAVAPDMLLMLQEVMDFSHFSALAYHQKYPHAGGTRKDLNARIQAMIAKATGQTEQEATR